MIQSQHLGQLIPLGELFNINGNSRPIEGKKEKYILDQEGLSYIGKERCGFGRYLTILALLFLILIMIISDLLLLVQPLFVQNYIFEEK